MNITRITAEQPACFGVCCPLHGTCRRYAAVEGSHPVPPIATCQDGVGARPHYLPIHHPPTPALATALA